MNEHSFFSASYEQARVRFRAAAVATGADITSYALAEHHQPDDEPLSCDVALIGPPQATRVLLSISGTHGVEGFAGSAAQLNCMLGPARQWAEAGIGMLFVHAINPWGFSNVSRTNENNVDLNRNFVAHPQGESANPLYARLDQVLDVAAPSEEVFAAVLQQLAALAEEVGWARLGDAMVRGQYSHPQGLFYGGCRDEWSNGVVTRIAREFLGRAERVAVIDWHTGLGQYGEPMYLPFGDPLAEPHRRTLSWWGEEAVAASLATYRSGQRPNYTGLVFDGVQRAAGHALVAGGVVEFGTRNSELMTIALVIDRWLRFRAAGSGVEPRPWRERVLNEFCPAEPEWRAAVLKVSADIYQRTVCGLQDWT